MRFKIHNVIKEKNKIGLINIDVTPELRELVRDHYKRERCTKKLISTFINEGIQTVQLFKK